MGTPLDDRDLAADIALLGEVMAAVAGEDHDLSDAEVDHVLGVDDAPVEVPPDEAAEDARRVASGDE